MKARLRALLRLPLRLLERLTPSPAARLASGLSALVVCLLLVADLTAGLFPDRLAQATERREAMAELIATYTASTPSLHDPASVRALLERIAARDMPELRSVAIRTAAGEIVGRIGDHDQRWMLGAAERSTETQMRVPIQQAGRPWGTIEITFAPVYPQTVEGWMSDPFVLTMGTLVTALQLAFYLYLRRTLRAIDPTQSVPTRVRNAFDMLGEGVLVLDPDGRIMLANESFRRLLPSRDMPLNGRLADELRCIAGPLLAACGGQLPWARVMTTGDIVTLPAVQLQDDAGKPLERRVGVRCQPVRDLDGALRGCLVTFDDVSQLHDANTHLKAALAELNASRAKVRLQNEKLQHLASRDPLTGSLNRRAFFEAIATWQETAGTTPLAVVLCDVDHFKSFNDRYGHAVGDEVLCAVTSLLTAQCRSDDLVCRLGGEEFCMAFPGMTLAQATARAERIRAAMERGCAANLSVRIDRSITASFGVAVMEARALRTEQLIDRADQAMYRAKKGGRNRVESWSAAEAPASEPA